MHCRIQLRQQPNPYHNEQIHDPIGPILSDVCTRFMSMRYILMTGVQMGPNPPQTGIAAGRKITGNNRYLASRGRHCCGRLSHWLSAVPFVGLKRSSGRCRRLQSASGRCRGGAVKVDAKSPEGGVRCNSGTSAPVPPNRESASWSSVVLAF